MTLDSFQDLLSRLLALWMALQIALLDCFSDCSPESLFGLLSGLLSGQSFWITLSWGVFGFASPLCLGSRAGVIVIFEVALTKIRRPLPARRVGVQFCLLI